MATPAIYVIADRLAPKLRAAFLAAIALIRSQATLPALAAAIEAGDLAAILAATHVAQLPAALAPAVAVIEEVVTRAAEHIVTELAVDASFRLVNPLATAAARTQGARLVQSVTTETRDAIRALVGRAFPDAIAPRELATLIKPLIGLTKKQVHAVVNAQEAWRQAGLTGDALQKKVVAYAKQKLQERAVNIARTETIAAATNGQRAAWQGAVRAGLLDPSRTWRIWSAASDQRVCPICEGLDEQVVGFDEPFVTIDGDEVMAPPVHPQCRCSVSLTFDGRRSAA